MARERVVINIEVNSDVATIEATRLSLERLTNQSRDLNNEHERNKKTIQNVTKENNKLKKDNDAVGNSLRNVGKDLKTAKSRWDGFGKAVFSFRKDLGGLISGFGGLIGLVNKLSLLEIPVLAAGMAGIALLFKSGTGFVNLFRAAMSSMAYVAAGVGVAVTTVVAAMREFQSVGYASQYSGGAGNTTDRFVAASQAMKMFVDNATLAVVGAESLGKAFGILSKQAPVTAKTTAAFEGLMNVVAGSGGDMGKGAQALAEFIAKVQKGGLGAAGAEAKALGPDFQKIIKEAQALGIKTQDEFFKAAAEGALGKTFQEKYAGQLDAINSTLIGTFKRSVASVKGLLIDLGQQFLGPARDGVARLQLIVEKTLIRLSPMLREFGTNTFINDVVGFIDKAADKLVYLMNRYLGTTPGLIEYFGKVIDKISGFFERIQDWARQFKDAGQALIDNFFKPVIDGVIDKFGGGMNTLADLVVKNGPLLKSLADNIVSLISAIGDYGNMLKEAFIAAIPLLNIALKAITGIFTIFTKTANLMLKAFGSLGSGAKALAALPILYASLTLFSRFFKQGGSFFGKDMSVRANNVYVNGQPVGGGYGRGGGMGGGGGAAGTGRGAFMRGFRSYQPQYGPVQGGRFANNRFVRGLGNFGGRLGYGAQGLKGNIAARIGSSKIINNLGGLGSIAALAGSMALDPVGRALESKTAGGGAKGYAAGAASQTTKAAQLGLTAGSMAQMLGATGTAAGGFGAIAGLSMLAGKGIGSLIKSDSKLARGGGALAGAGAGALIGAGIGSVIPGVGTAAGAVVGAIVGGVAAYAQAGKARRQAKEAAAAVLDNFYSETEKMFKAGDVAGLNEQLATLRKTIEESAAGDINTYNQKIAEAEPKIRDLTNRIERFTKNTELAKRYLNMSSDEMNKLAEATGVNLQTNLLSLREIIEMTGRSAADQARLMKAAWSEINGAMVGGILGKFQNLKEQKQLGESLNAEQMKFLGGPQNEEAMNALMEAQLKYSISQFGEAGGIANAYKTLTGPDAFKPGGALYGMTPDKQQAFISQVNTMMNPAAVLKEFVTPDMMALLQNEVGFKGMNNQQIFNNLIDKLAANPYFLDELQTAQQTGSDFAVGQVTGGYVPTGPAVPTAVRRQEPQQVVTNQNTYQVNLPNGTILTPQVLKMIEDHWKQMQRTTEERGGI